MAVKGVNYTFGTGESRIQVLFDNNLTLNPGEIVIMTGPSGSGKTTLLTLIGSLRAVQDGSLQVIDRELRGLNRNEQVKVRRNIGFIFQAHNLFESLTAYQNVKMATDLFDYAPGEAKKSAEKILQELELGAHIHKKPHNLSGGQRQRVAICRALVNRPRLILADEPTAALDKDTSRLVVGILQKRAKEEQATVMIVTHDNRILDVADRIVRMVDGYVDSDVEVAESLTAARFLKKCHIFADFNATVLAEIANKMLKETHPTGSKVITQGEEGDKFYIIRSGRMEVSKETDGKRESIAELGPGDFFGELALLRREPRAATVTAIQDVELLTLSEKLFLEIVEGSRSFEDQLKNAYFYK